MTRAGVATAILGIHNRYMHIPYEVVSLKDIDNAIKLLVTFIQRLDGEMSYIPQCNMNYLNYLTKSMRLSY